MKRVLHGSGSLVLRQRSKLMSCGLSCVKIQSVWVPIIRDSCGRSNPKNRM